MADFDVDMAAPFGVKARGGAVSLKVIGRVLVTAYYPGQGPGVSRFVTAPKGTSFVRASACGSGGMGFYAGSAAGGAGGGGVGFYEGPCAAGDTFQCNAGGARSGSGDYGTPGNDSSVFFNSKELCAGLGGIQNGGNPIGGAGGGWRGQDGVNGGKGGDANPTLGSTGNPGESVGGCPGGPGYFLSSGYPGVAGGGAPGALGSGGGYQYQEQRGRLGGGGSSGYSGVAAPTPSGEGWCLLEFYG